MGWPIKVFFPAANGKWGDHIDGEVFVKSPLSDAVPFCLILPTSMKDMRLKLRKIINRQALKKKEQEAVARSSCLR